MKKLLKIVSESGEKARIDEGVNVSINVSGDSPCDVGEVLAKVTNLSSPRPVTPDMMPAPSAPPPMPMVKALDIVGKADEPSGPGVPPAPPGDMEPHIAPEAIGQSVMMPDPSEEPTGGPSTSSQVGGATMGGSEEELEALISDAESQLGLGEGDPEDYDDNSSDYGPGDFADDEVDRLKDEPEDESLLDLAMGSAHGEGDKSKALTMNSSYKDIHDRLKEIDQALKSKNEEFANKPNPKTSDADYMLNKLSHNPQTMYKHSYKQGDNPMAMETVVRDEWEKFKLGE